MTALRMTPSAILKTTRSFLWACASLAALGAFGCGSPSPSPDDSAPPATAAPGANDPAWLTSRGTLPAPDTDRIEYDPQKQTLILHPLPGNDYWMVQLPGEQCGRRVGPIHRLPEGVDTTSTLVYYARPGVKVSAVVTVAQIEAGRVPHSSQAIIR